MTMGGFTGKPLVLGSVRGIRIFEVRAGELFSLNAPRFRWRDGENIAGCNLQVYSSTTHEKVDAGVVRAKKQPRANEIFDQLCSNTTGRLDDEDHQIETCSHGFYAYYTQEHLHRQFGRVIGYMGDFVVGIIEGYGETVLGTKGFRTSKARIVALMHPHKSIRHQYPNAKFFPQHHKNLYPNPWVSEGGDPASIQMLKAFPLSVPDLVQKETA